MDVSMGGRIAEELIFGKEKITGGASSDLSSATRTAVSMVKKLGMSEKVGLRVQYDDPVQMLAEALLKYETLDAEDVRCIVEQKRPPTASQRPSSPGGTNVVPGRRPLPPLPPLPLPATETSPAP